MMSQHKQEELVSSAAMCTTKLVILLLLQILTILCHDSSRKALLSIVSADRLTLAFSAYLTQILTPLQLKYNVAPRSSLLTKKLLLLNYNAIAQKPPEFLWVNGTRKSWVSWTLKKSILKGYVKEDQKPSSSLSNEFLEFFQMHLKLLKSRNDPIKFSKKWSKITL